MANTGQGDAAQMTCNVDIRSWYINEGYHGTSG